MTYAEHIEVVKRDLMAKYERQDWHGVMDCAADLRELEVHRQYEEKPTYVVASGWAQAHG